MIVTRLLTVLFFILGTTLCCSAERPNVLFVLTEDHGSHLSLLDTPGLKTPHMDSLAKSGTYFSNAFVAYPDRKPRRPRRTPNDLGGASSANPA